MVKIFWLGEVVYPRTISPEPFHHYRHYEGLRLLPSVCEQIIIQQTLISFLHEICATKGNCTKLMQSLKKIARD